MVFIICEEVEGPSFALDMTGSEKEGGRCWRQEERAKKDDDYRAQPHRVNNCFDGNRHSDPL